MADAWTVADAWLVAGRCVEWQLAQMYSDARHRVLRSPRLREYMSIIMDDGWSGDEDHLRWVIRGRVGEIEQWARKIKVEAGT